MLCSVFHCQRGCYSREAGVAVNGAPTAAEFRNCFTSIWLKSAAIMKVGESFKGRVCCAAARMQGQSVRPEGRSEPDSR